MNRAWLLIGVGAFIAAAASSRPQAASPQSAAPPAISTSSVSSENRATLDRYCVTCHNQRAKEPPGQITLDNLDLSRIADSAETWEKVVRRLHAGTMPPQPARRPDPATYERLINSLEAELDRAAAANPNPGRPVLHRLNRAEYANAIRDVLAVDVDVASMLPPDDSAYGFDNISDVLGVSPSLQERYLTAAKKVSALAVGDPSISPGSEAYRIRQDLSQDQHLDGLPLGTIGGIQVRHTFPLDGEYSFQVKLYRTNLNIVRGLQYPHDVEFTVDGQRIHLTTIGGKADLTAMFEKPTDTGDAVDARLRVRVPVKAGPRTVTVAFVQDPAVEDSVRLQGYVRSSADNFDWAGRPHMQTLAITGPFNATGPGDTPSRRRIFLRPRPSSREEAPCAKEILSTVARRAYRRPVTDADFQPLLSFYNAAGANGGFEPGFRWGSSACWPARSSCSVSNATRRGRRRQRLSRQRSGARLAAVVLPLEQHARTTSCSMLAAAGQLRIAARSTRRCAGCWPIRKAQALVSNFAGQWLQLRNLRGVSPNRTAVPRFRRQPAAGDAAARPSSSSRASSAKTAACSIC